MTAYQQVPLQMLPLSDNMMGYRQVNNEQYQKLAGAGGIGAVERTGVDVGTVKGDLLPDLWLMPSGHENSSTSSTPSSTSPRSSSGSWRAASRG